MQRSSKSKQPMRGDAQLVNNVTYKISKLGRLCLRSWNVHLLSFVY